MNKPKRKKTGPKCGPNGHRVRLGPRGPHIDPNTLSLLNAWRTAYGVPWGRSIDALVEHAHKHKGFILPLKGRTARGWLADSPEASTPALETAFGSADPNRTGYEPNPNPEPHDEL